MLAFSEVIDESIMDESHLLESIFRRLLQEAAVSPATGMMQGEGAGNISEVHFYDRALTDAEILQNFNVDKSKLRHGL